ncbi:diacylglycerol kinase family protein [Opitutus sp. GAS368]|uniref:diacylglycerol/lipid kinase family protein n=1 Tax=Opitutus sp. GAS368 TaxID=1882749 RepID=UPI00087DC71A|nr:diacylglycerol kinase family protein [Opitutus sp. GAS368]SDR67498.1 lipid kinase, YegS/Rv2252/BmrU family [Opitutus sp. GAS368]
MKARFIFNPYSGRNRRNPYLRDRAATFIKERRLDATVVDTERPRHATELARQAVDEGCGLVVAIGGDGTMNEVATALVDTPAVFGLIPCGSGNGLGRHLGIRQPGHGAFRTLLDGRPMPIDTGLVNGFAFFNAMGLGFEADIAVRFSRQTNRGLAGYIRVGFPSFFAHQPERCTVRHAGGTAEVDAFTLAVMNSDQYGNDARVAPGAKLDDGRFELISVPQVGFLGACGMLYRLGTDSFDQVKAVTRFSGAEFVIERTKPGWIHTDGEPRATTSKLEITLKPRSLRIMVPAEA